MKLHDIISINPSILEKILLEEVKKIPGVSMQNIQSIKVNDAACCIDVILTPFSLLSNVYSIANELQQAISFHLTNQFDIDEGKVKINVIILPPEGDK